MLDPYASLKTKHACLPFQLGALVTGVGLAGKLIAAVLLTLPLRARSDARPQ